MCVICRIEESVYLAQIRINGGYSKSLRVNWNKRLAMTLNSSQYWKYCLWLMHQGLKKDIKAKATNRSGWRKRTPSVFKYTRGVARVYLGRGGFQSIWRAWRPQRSQRFSPSTKHLPF